MTQAVRVLMVCLGNICRSPTAEAVFRARVQSAGLEHCITVDSAGTSDWHLDKAPHPPSIAAAAERGYALHDLRGRQVSDEDFERFDYLLAMDQQNLRDLQSRCPEHLQHKLALFLSHGNSGREEVPDPYGLEANLYTEVLDLVEDASDALLEHLVRRHALQR